MPPDFIPKQLYREIDDELRGRGDGLALSCVLSDVERLFSLYRAKYPKGRGSKFVIHVEIQEKP